MSKNTFRLVSCGGIEPPTPSITPEHKPFGVTIQLFAHPIIIALSALQENAVIESGAPYIIDTKSIGFIFRNVYERGDKYECKVSNQKSQLEDINIEKSDVIKIYRVVGLVRTNF